jgi:hypothetical protein
MNVSYMQWRSEIEKPTRIGRFVKWIIAALVALFTRTDEEVPVVVKEKQVAALPPPAPVISVRQRTVNMRTALEHMIKVRGRTCTMRGKRLSWNWKTHGYGGHSTVCRR